MNNIKEILERHNYHLKGISYRKNAKVLDTEEGKLIYKIKKKDKKDLFSYLKTKNFNNYLPIVNDYQEPFELYEYIKEKKYDNQDKAMDLIYTLSMLHIKTTTYENIDLDEVKRIYEDTMKEISYLNSYYLDLQDYIETKVYMSPAEYLLMRNISKIYFSLNHSANLLENWYQEKIKQKKERHVLLHQNLSLEHFLKEEEGYFISWDHSKKGPVIYDFLNFYKNEYLTLEMESLYELYQSKYQFSQNEKSLFFSLLLLPPKVQLNKTNYINTLEVRNLVIYIEKTNHFVSQEYEKYKKADEEKFK